MSQVSNSSDGSQAVVTVHELSEFVFCPRAGLLAFENRTVVDDEPDSLHFDFSLPYSGSDLDRSLQIAMRCVWFQLGAGSVSLALTAFVLWKYPLALVATTIVIGLSLVAVLRTSVPWMLQLITVRGERLARTASSSEPDEPRRQTLNWWELLASGWMSMRPLEPYYDDDLQLAGRPWRVMRRGLVGIPIFRIAVPAETQEPRLFPKHQLRAVAYTHLLRVAEGLETPVAGVLVNGTYEVTTLPCATERPSILSEQLAAFRATIVKGQAKAPHYETCRGCPWGRPRPYHKDLSSQPEVGRRFPVHGTPFQGQLYHSDCGDRFEWVPPHQLAEGMPKV